jgi:hypothetical protein
VKTCAVTATPKQETGMLVIRVWAEEDDETLRARITGSTAVFSVEQRAVAGVDEICDEVRAWLERMGRRQP